MACCRKDLKSGQVTHYETEFVFIGAGGASLPLLQKQVLKNLNTLVVSVSGLFLRCKNPDVIQRHYAKVYGKAEVGAPPMSVPHLDTRFVNGERSLLFGPFAGFSPKFLKTGSYLDLIKSVKPNNIVTMLSAGVKEFNLTKYLVSQLMLSNEERVDDLQYSFLKRKMKIGKLSRPVNVFKSLKTLINRKVIYNLVQK